MVTSDFDGLTRRVGPFQMKPAVALRWASLVSLTAAFCVPRAAASDLSLLQIIVQQRMPF